MLKSDTLASPAWATPQTGAKNGYDDGNIPEIDLPGKTEFEEPLPEYTRPRKDGPGGE